MKTGLITEQHKQWLKNHFGVTFEEVEKMTDEESDILCQNLLEAECDALEADEDELNMINEVQDIIFDEPYPESEDVNG